jgi:HNH endonuclease
MPRITLKCKQCNSSFQVWPYRMNCNVQYCSRRCKGSASRGQIPPNRANLVGAVFGALTVIAFEGTAGGHTVWRCRCTCGNETTVRNGNLQSGGVRSCGRSLRRTGDQHPNWRCGYTISTHGYKHVLIDAPERTNRYEAEHRVVMASVMGRPLNMNEIVHHINRIKTDNRPENLQVLSREEHAALHAAENRRAMEIA